MQGIIDFFGNIFNSIIDVFINIFNGLASGLLELIGSWFNSLGLSATIPADVFLVLNDLTRSVGYIFPVAALLPIVSFFVVFYVGKLIFAIYNLIANTIISRIHIG